MDGRGASQLIVFKLHACMVACLFFFFSGYLTAHPTTQSANWGSIQRGGKSEEERKKNGKWMCRIVSKRGKQRVARRQTNESNYLETTKTQLIDWC